MATSAAATSGTSIGVNWPNAVRREATGTVTADARFNTPANAIAAAPIRRVRRRMAVESPADGQVTVPGCSATSAGGQHDCMRPLVARRSSSVRSGRSRAPCHSRTRSSDPASSSSHEQRNRAP